MKPATLLALPLVGASLLAACVVNSAKQGPTYDSGDQLAGQTTVSSKHRVTVEGVSFAYGPSLAEGASALTIPAFVDPSGFVYNDIPEHLRFDFTAPYTAYGPFADLQPGWVPWLSYQTPDDLGIRPQIFVFPTTEYAEISPLASERIEALSALLDGDAPPAGGELPLLPTFNSAQDLQAQVQALPFQGGRGVRYIARYSQGVAPVVNPEVFYTFQGLTDDGGLYIAAFFPVHVSILPDQIQVEDWEAFNQDYQGYVADAASGLDVLEAGDFEPNLETLDALIGSLAIDTHEWAR